jgi:Bacterial SH3 domain
MARLIEIDDPVRDRYDNSPRGSGGGILVILGIIFLIILLLGAFGPWYVNTPVLTNPVEEAYRPFSNVSYVTVDNLNLRVRPNYYSDVTYVLPRGTRVDILGESYQEPDGDMWLRVRVQTFYGWQYGWVNQRYIA